MIIIKKYPNRRLYDTEHSKYVNLEYILGLIKEHKDFQVVDSKTGSDQTKAILLQIITEQETDENRSLLTNTLLKQLIRFYNSDMQPMVRNYMEQALAGFLEQQEAMQQMVKNMVATNPMNLYSKMFEQNLKMWETPTSDDKDGDK